MKFRLDTARYLGENIGYRKFLKEYPCLEKYNLKVETHKYNFAGKIEFFKIGFIEINSLEELMQLSEDTRNQLIIDKDNITIYDDDIE